jgi:hypothetical protein
MVECELVSRRTLIKGSLALTAAGLLRLRASAEATAAGEAAAEAASPGPAGALSFRHIHLDFHTSPAITGVGKNFNAAEFADTLKDAEVNSITIFAKCHHGMAYYPTKIGIQHPNLSFDLLGQMMEACHRQGIRTPVYISTLYDQYAWHQHGDWRALDPDGQEEGHRRSCRPDRSAARTAVRQYALRGLPFCHG